MEKKTSRLPFSVSSENGIMWKSVLFLWDIPNAIFDGEGVGIRE